MILTKRTVLGVKYGKFMFVFFPINALVGVRSSPTLLLRSPNSAKVSYHYGCTFRLGILTLHGARVPALAQTSRELYRTLRHDAEYQPSRGAHVERHAAIACSLYDEVTL